MPAPVQAAELLEQGVGLVCLVEGAVPLGQLPLYELQQPTCCGTTVPVVDLTDAGSPRTGIRVAFIAAVPNQ